MTFRQWFKLQYPRSRRLRAKDRDRLVAIIREAENARQALHEDDVWARMEDAAKQAWDAKG